MSATLSPDRILKELTDLWVKLGQEGQREAGAGVLRACAMTLVVLTETSEDTAALGETIAALMPEHPARTVIIRLQGGGARTLSDRVYAQCWMPFGQRRQICCEQIEITASDAALADLPLLVLPLAAPDLPVVVWCRSLRLLGMKEFTDIAGIAHKVVFDSGAVADPRDALRRFAATAESGVLLGDLAWTRMTRWRAMLSQVFENKQHLAQLPNVKQVLVEYAPTYDTAAWYMAAWIADGLSDGGVTPSLEVRPAQSASTMHVQLTGEGVSVELARDEATLIVRVNELSNCTSLSRPTDYLLMREELAIVRHDPVYERTLASAARLAYATSK